MLTSAVRDASNGAAFAERVRNELQLDARVLSGDEEAQLTFLGAMAGRPAPTEPTVVIDIGGGSTEFVVGVGHTAATMDGSNSPLHCLSIVSLAARIVTVHSARVSEAVGVILILKAFSAGCDGNTVS